MAIGFQDTIKRLRIRFDVLQVLLCIYIMLFHKKLSDVDLET